MFILLLWGCVDAEYAQCQSDESWPDLSSQPTWHADVRPLVEQHCAACHSPGGLSPIALTTFETAAPMAQLMAENVQDQVMPPWPPVDCCRVLKDRKALDAEARAVFAAWAEAGAPEGDPADYRPPVIADDSLDRVDRRIEMPEAYTPDPGNGTDDTRCFLIDWPEEERTYVTGFAVQPGVPSQVHHVTALTVSSLALPSLQALDALDRGPGWSCPGGLVLGATGWIGAWSPGWGAREMPGGTGQRMDPSDRVVLTMHYSVTAGEPQPDRTAVDLRLEDEVDSNLKSIPIYDPAWLVGLRIPADDPDYRISYSMRPWSRREIVGVNMHMHERGKSGMVGVQHADGSIDCLLQIDDWEQEWQGDYSLEEPLRLVQGDKLFVECHFDNTASNQRLIDGVPEEPRTLNWKEDEEMCVAFVQTRE